MWWNLVKERLQKTDGLLKLQLQDDLRESKDRILVHCSIWWGSLDQLGPGCDSEALPKDHVLHHIRLYKAQQRQRVKKRRPSSFCLSWTRLKTQKMTSKRKVWSTEREEVLDEEVAVWQNLGKWAFQWVRTHKANTNLFDSVKMSHTQSQVYDAFTSVLTPRAGSAEQGGEQVHNFF